MRISMISRKPLKLMVFGLIVLTLLTLGILLPRYYQVYNINKQIQKLSDKDVDIQNQAVKTLVKIGTPSVKPLITVLKNKNSNIRSRAAEVLGKIKDKRAVGQLISIMNNDVEPDVQSRASTALVKIGIPSVEPLIAVFRLKRSKMRERARLALKKIGAPAVIPLIDALKDENIDFQVEAIMTLREIKDQRAIEPLIAMLDKDSLGDQDQPYSGTMARDALESIGKPAVESLINALEDKYSDVRIQAALALGHIKDKHAVKPLIAVLKDEDSKIQIEAILALLQIGDNRAVKPLIVALNRSGNTGIGELYLNSGNIALENAAKAWGKRNGYSVSSKKSDIPNFYSFGSEY